MEEKHSISEQIISTKGRSSLKQYLPKKPNKWGIKVWARCGVLGIIYDFEVYTGNSDKNETDNDKLFMGGNVVHRLIRTLEKDKNYEVYCDNFFSSINLMLKLKEECSWAIATVRRDRLKGAKTALRTKKDLKKQGRGSADYLIDVNSGIAIVQWCDNNIVQLISNYMTQELGTAAKRCSKKDKKLVLLIAPK